MKLFGTVIAVLFQPGSTSKLNGKNFLRSGENSLKKKLIVVLFPSCTSFVVFVLFFAEKASIISE